MFEDIFSIITILAVVALLAFYLFFKKKDGKDWVYAVYFLVVVITGTTLYALGLSYKNDGDTAFSPMFIFSKALASVLKSFGGDFNASALAKIAEDYPWIAVAAFVNYLAAVLLTFLLAIKLFGKNIVNRLKVFANSFLSQRIVVGYGEQAQIFLKNITGKKWRTTVILESDNKKKRTDLIEEGYAVLVIADGVEKRKAGNDELTVATYEALKKAGAFRAKRDTKIIAMSENDEQNLLVAKIVTEYIKGKIKPERNAKGKIKLSDEQTISLKAINLRAFIMYSFWDRTEHFAFTEYALGKVRFFNPYEIRARKFATDNPVTSMIPAAWVDMKKAKLRKTYGIGNIFVGFGWTNKQILKKSICNNQLLGVDYKALIVDKAAKKHEKQFKNGAIGLFRPELKSEIDENGEKRYFASPNEESRFDFNELDVLSLDFYDRVRDEVKNNDFSVIVIALGDDKLSLETALELRQKLYESDLLTAERDGTKYARVKIFVKIIEKSVFSDKSLLNNGGECEIRTFGADKEILTEEYIVGEKLDVIAKRIANEYCDNSSSAVAAFTKWDTLPDIERESNRYVAMSIRTKLNLLGFELKESDEPQDVAIERAYSEAYGMERAAAQQVAVKKQWNNGDFSDGYIDFPERVGDTIKIADTARNNLARLEHQRWNAFYFSSGWTKLEKSKITVDFRKDLKAKQHACLTVFEELDKLRDLQAGDGADAQAKSNADTVRYDFFLNDKLFGNLKGSGYAVTLKGEDRLDG
jgi:hypothetical protein